jgi:hypothetical protein
MSRNKAVTVPVADLPAYFRSEHDANLIALAIEAEAQHTRDAANAPDLPEVVALTIRAQAQSFQTAADETRDFAKRLAKRSVEAVEGER